MFKNFEEIIANIQGGKSSVGLTEDSSLVVAYAPIKLGRTGKPWSVLIRIPADVVLADAHALNDDLSSRARSGALW